MTGDVVFNGHSAFFSSGNSSWIYGDSDENLILGASSAEVCKISDGILEFISGGQTIRGVNNPTNDSDAANKGYVDDLVGNINTVLDTINGEVV